MNLYNLAKNLNLILERHIKIKCPVKTGNLKSKLERIKPEVSNESITIGTFTRVKYAPFVAKRTGFMLKGAMSAKPEMIAEIKRLFSK